MRNIFMYEYIQLYKDESGGQKTFSIKSNNIGLTWKKRKQQPMRMCLTSKCALKHSVKFGCKIHLFFEHWHPIHSLHKITPNEIYSFGFQMCFFPSFLYISILSGWNEKTKKKKMVWLWQVQKIHGIDDLMKKEKKKTNWKTKINFSPTCIRGSRATYAIAQIRLDLFSSRKATALKMFINSNIDVVNAADKPPKWPQMACLSLERQKKGSLTNNKFQMVTNKYKWRRTNHGFPLKREKVEKKWAENY